MRLNQRDQSSLHCSVCAGSPIDSRSGIRPVIPDFCEKLTRLLTTTSTVYGWVKESDIFLGGDHCKV